MTAAKALKTATAAQGYKTTAKKMSLTERFRNYMEENALFFAMAASTPDQALRLYRNSVKDSVNA
ncbi:MAG: hypothetical protein VZR02_08330 [Lachnospiraceae bacterium]|nr:hypothetical protein [Lachnospiraceae bacterium]